jgi:hypothetical protein
MLITVGDWVVYNNEQSMFYGTIGFVTSYATDDGFYVRLVRGKDGETYSRVVYCKERSLKRITDEYLMDDTDYNILMDMALSMHDYEWCREIQQKYEKVCAMCGRDMWLHAENVLRKALGDDV